MEDWYDTKGVKHAGLIDKEYSADYVKKYPNAINKVRLLTPHTYKSEMYKSLIEMINQDCISFPADYDGKGYISLFESDEKIIAKAKKSIVDKHKKENLSEDELNKLIDDELKNVSYIYTKMVKLDFFEQLALSNIDALKEELVNMVCKKRDSGRDSFELTPEKQNILHDDRAYCCAMCAYQLFQKRLENIRKPQRQETSHDLFQVRKPAAIKSHFR